jgi:hypothetical protein
MVTVTAVVSLSIGLSACGTKAHKATTSTTTTTAVNKNALNSVPTPNAGSQAADDPGALESSIDASINNVTSDLSSVDSAPASEGDVVTGAGTSNTTTAGSGATQLATIRGAADTAVKARISKLETLKSRITESKDLTAPHQSGMLAEITSDENGLTTLDATVQSDATSATATADAGKIVTQYRVYVLEVPKFNEVMAADAIAAANVNLQAAIPKFSAALAARQQNGVDISAAQTALADLNAKASAIARTNGEMVEPLLAMTPAGYPANRPTMISTRQALGTELNQVKTARSDITTITAAIA